MSHPATSYDVCLNYWYSYSCMCTLNPGVDDGTFLEIKIAQRDVAPPILCPICGQAMDYRGCWSEDHNGYGSSGDNVSIANFCKAVTALEQEQNAKLCEKVIKEIEECEDEKFWPILVEINVPLRERLVSVAKRCVEMIRGKRVP